MTTQRKTRCTCKPCPACGGRGYTTDGRPEDYCRACEAAGFSDLNCRVHFPHHVAVKELTEAWAEFQGAIYAALIPGIYRAMKALDRIKGWFR